jgi:hypothetical protein
MTQHRPDLLPFAQPRVVGLPCHGLVTDGELTLPSSRVITYRQPTKGTTILVEHQEHHAVAASEFDTSRGYQWLEYALISGTARQIGGKDLGANRHLYCDGNVAWIVEVEPLALTNQATVTVNLIGLFGVLSGDYTQYAMTERQLAYYAWTPVAYDGGPHGITPPPTLGNRTLATVNKTGSKMLLNVGSYGTVGLANEWQYTPINGGYAEGSVSTGYQHDLLTITFEGAGSLLPGHIGEGITATIEHTYDAADLRITHYFPSYGNFDTVYDTAFVLTPDGVTKKIRRESHGTWIQELTPEGTNFAITRSYSYTVFGVLYESSEAISGRWAGDTTYTETINGVTESGTETGIYAGRAPTGEPAHIHPYVHWIARENLATYTTTVDGTSAVASGGEMPSDYWSYHPQTLVLSHSATADICWV